MAFDATADESMDIDATVAMAPKADEENAKIGEAILRPRYYQIEMLEESMKRNIIVAVRRLSKVLVRMLTGIEMDTGSGKSLIAVLRIQEELERCSADKLVFVLVPTVALAAQWHSVISTQLPFIQTRFLSGADGVERWGDQWIWDEFLQGVRVVVCTFQILLDALAHGFIRMSGLALLVLDEAHHCVEKHPSNRIMRDFYHSVETTRRPAILGLTASPQTRGKSGDLELVESNLDAIARTPRLHREELLRHVFEPELVKLRYQSPAFAAQPEILQKLIGLRTNLDIEQDPYVIKCRADQSASSSKQLMKALASRKTYCQDQLKSLYAKSSDILEELGTWATGYYMYTIIENFCAKTSEHGFSMFEGLDDTEKIYLKKILRFVKPPDQMHIGLNESLENEIIRISPVAGFTTGPCLSAKVQCLIDYLAEVVTDEFTGLVFVKTRATCAVLGNILSVHAKTKDKLRVSTFVGVSSSPSRKFDMGELVDIKNQTNTLDQLRRGHKNLVIATSVLEEGIDVSACNVVICFEKPPNLKAFIQRRGRARKSKSKYVLMFPEDDDLSQLSTWRQLEDEMRQNYIDEIRQVEKLRLLEAADSGRREFVVESTGAKLTLDDAVQHLYHFCATLPADPYVDIRPIFTFTQPYEGGPVKETSETVKLPMSYRMLIPGSATARVTLPNSVDSGVREAFSPSEWVSEKLAKRDAAFEAYIALYHAGLVSDHLLPLRGYDESVSKAQSTVQKIVSTVDIDEQRNIWSLIAQEWRDSSAIHSLNLLIAIDSKTLLEMSMLLPRPLPRALDFNLYWDAFTTFQATARPGPFMPQATLHARAAADSTALLLRSVFGTRMDSQRTDFVARFVPTGVIDLTRWNEQNCGTTAAESLFDQIATNDCIGLVRENGVPHISGGIERLQPDYANDQLDGARQSIQETIEEEIGIRVKRLPKRADFLHPIPGGNMEKSGPNSKLLPATNCTVDNLPFVYSQFALLIPSILHTIEINMIAEDLCNNILPSVGFNDLSLVLTAISTTAAQEATNYQRLEFLGDSILKAFTSLTLLVTHLNWHEGVLSHQKDHIVSNATLARATLAKGLDKYILTKPFTGQKWRPLYISDLLSENVPAKRQLSTKTLADIVESLIGAAYLEGGTEKALACLQALLPATEWTPLDQLCTSIYATYDLKIKLPPPYEPLENIIGHKFTLPSLLLEAITHSSHHGLTPSYQRLEFLGDSILDRIITITAFNHTPSIETHTLHLIRTALVNANFLAYHCLTLSTPTRQTSLTTNPDNTLTALSTPAAPLALWTFMRHSSPAVRLAQTACVARYNTLKTSIATQLHSGNHYPWALLAALEAPKFLSDLVESVLGAIYIDSKGDVGACERFLERLGVMAYLRRVMQRRGVGVKHPKEEVGVVADKEGVRYEVFKEGEGEEGKKELRCRVWVGGRMVTEVGRGTSVMEVETRGAEEAVRILKGEKGML